MSPSHRPEGAPGEPLDRLDAPPALPGGVRATVARGLRRGGTQYMLLGSLASGVAAYLFQIVGTRTLGEEAYAPISVLWTIQYLLLTIVLYSVETYVTRHVTLQATGRADQPPAWGTVAIWLAAMALLLGGVAYALRGPLFSGYDDLWPVVAVTVLTYGIFVVARGRYAGAGRFLGYGLVTGTESVVRLVLAIGVAVTVASTRSFAWIMPVGALVAAGWWLVTGHRRSLSEAAAHVRSELAHSQPGRFLAVTTAANACGQVLLAGGPLLLVALAAAPPEISIFFITVTAARVPVVLAIGGLLSRVLPTFTRMAAEGDLRRLRRATLGIALGTGLVAVLGGVAGGLVGSDVVALFFGRSFAPPWWLAAGTALGVLLATGAMMLNQVLIALGREQRLLAPWILALTIAVAAVVFTDGTATWRATVAFVTGEVLALAGLTLTVLVALSARRSWQPPSAHG